MSDEELGWRLEAGLRQLSEADMLAMAQEYPHFFTPKVLEKQMARWRELHGGALGDRVPG